MSTATTTIPDQVRAAIAQAQGVKVESITPRSTLAGDLGMDSLDLIEAVIAIEEDCGVEPADHDIEMAFTVGDLIALVERARGAA